MAKTEFKRMHKRGFFNRERGMAAYEANITVEKFTDCMNDPEKVKNGSYVNATLSLSDCFRKIELDFNAYRDNEKRIIEKAAMLRKVVNEFCDAVEATVEEAKEWRAATPKVGKKKKLPKLKEAA